MSLISEGGISLLIGVSLAQSEAEVFKKNKNKKPHRWSLEEEDEREEREVSSMPNEEGFRKRERK